MFLTAFCYKLLLSLLLIYNTFSGQQQKRPSFFLFLKITIQVCLLSFQNMRNQLLMFSVLSSKINKILITLLSLLAL